MYNDFWCVDPKTPAVIRITSHTKIRKIKLNISYSPFAVHCFFSLFFKELILYAGTNVQLKKLLIKVEIFGNFLTGSGRITMSVSMREL